MTECITTHPSNTRWTIHQTCKHAAHGPKCVRNSLAECQQRASLRNACGPLQNLSASRSGSSNNTEGNTEGNTNTDKSLVSTRSRCKGHGSPNLELRQGILAGTDASMAPSMPSTRSVPLRTSAPWPNRAHCRKMQSAQLDPQKSRALASGGSSVAAEIQTLHQLELTYSCTVQGMPPLRLFLLISIIV